MSSSLGSFLAIAVLSALSAVSFSSSVLRPNSVSFRLRPFEHVNQLLPPGSSTLLHSWRMGTKNATQGLTLNHCKTGRDCKGNRSCWKFKQVGHRRKCGKGLLCVCFPPKQVSCSRPKDCTEGEICVATMRTATLICMSPTADAPFEPNPWLPWADLSTEVTEPSEAEPSPTGLTYDACRQNKDCNGNRRCEFVGIFSKFDQCNGRQPCRCTPKSLFPCFDPQDCKNKGEVCTESAILSFAVCMSKTAPSLGKRVVPFTGVSPGLNLDTCKKNADCAGNRKCWDWKRLNNNGARCTTTRPCICFRRRGFACQKRDICKGGEVCSSLKPFRVPVCISEVMAKTFDGIQRFSPRKKST